MEKTFIHEDYPGYAYHVTVGTVKHDLVGGRFACLKIGMSFPGTSCKPIECAAIVIGAAMPESFHELRYIMESEKYPTEIRAEIKATFRPLVIRDENT